MMRIILLPCLWGLLSLSLAQRVGLLFLSPLNLTEQIYLQNSVLHHCNWSFSQTQRKVEPRKRRSTSSLHLGLNLVPQPQTLVTTCFVLWLPVTPRPVSSCLPWASQLLSHSSPWVSLNLLQQVVTLISLWVIHSLIQSYPKGPPTVLSQPRFMVGSLLYGWEIWHCCLFPSITANHGYL